MLLQSQGGVIRILLASPQRWPAGSVWGLVARGGYVIGIDWSAGRAKHITIHSRLQSRCRVKLDLTQARVLLRQAGRSVPFHRFPGEIIEFQTLAGEDYQLMVL
jgi:hypothetical protein